MIPLSLKIKKESHRQIALAQDLIVEEVYKKLERAVLHGGTALWRCYQGKRFSEDLDFYFPLEPSKVQELFDSLEKKGFKIIKRKISENSVYSELELSRVSVRLEATFQKITGHLVDYETIDGNYISIYSLTPEEFTREKINAYLQRRKVRDLYDLFFILKFVQNYSSVKSELKRLIKNFQSPVDEKELQVLILEGIVPNSKEMTEYIKRKWESANI